MHYTTGKKTQLHLPSMRTTNWLAVQLEGSGVPRALGSRHRFPTISGPSSDQVSQKNHVSLCVNNGPLGAYWNENIWVLATV